MVLANRMSCEGRNLVRVLIVGLSHGDRNVLAYTRRMMQNFLSFRDNPILPLRCLPTPGISGLLSLAPNCNKFWDGTDDYVRMGHSLAGLSFYKPLQSIGYAEGELELCREGAAEEGWTCWDWWMGECSAYRIIWRCWGVAKVTPAICFTAFLCPME